VVKFQIGHKDYLLIADSQLTDSVLVDRADFVNRSSFPILDYTYSSLFEVPKAADAGVFFANSQAWQLNRHAGTPCIDIVECNSI